MNLIIEKKLSHKEGRLRGIVANVLDCDNVVSEFEHQSFYYIHIRANTLEKGTNHFYTTGYCLNVFGLK